MYQPMVRMEASLTRWLYCISVLVSVNHVSNGQMVIEPPVAIQGAGESQYVNMTCSLTPEQQTSPISNLILISIGRNSTRDTNTEIVALMTSTGSAQLGTAQDVVARNPTVSGILHTGNGTIENPHRAELQLTWTDSTVECLDTGSYECKIAYLDGSLETANFVSSTSFTVTAIPSDIQLRAYRNGSPVDTDDDTISGVNVGDVVEMRCSGNIGSDPNTLIDWYHTDPLGSTDLFQDFVPSAEDDLQQGTATTVTSCQYRRVSTLLYNVTTMDAARTNNLAFKCAVTYNQHTADGDKLIYITLASHGENGAAIKDNRLYMYSIWIVLIATFYARVFHCTS